MGLVGVGLRRGSTCQRDVATHTLHGAAVRCTQSTCSLLGRLGVRVVGDEQVKLRLSERLSDPAADAARAASHDSSATQSIALRDQEQQRHTHHLHALFVAASKTRGGGGLPADERAETKVAWGENCPARVRGGVGVLTRSVSHLDPEKQVCSVLKNKAALGGRRSIRSIFLARCLGRPPS